MGGSSVDHPPSIIPVASYNKMLCTLPLLSYPQQGPSGHFDMTILPFSSDTLGMERLVAFKDSGLINSRSEFPESWLWLDYKLPSCPPGLPHW